ncbi:unnamed protein product (macronuclear) [Paramecium tetraurelia]|uniref:Uncharacterized protein n=1 Tax=Paramecium tetraurelia TaxID=5888 RepID=A0E3M1_PARTE|nr:uncharacterized protein GSPATT00023061001 [Paramecium tetraurelia]CAK89888.1 unnamed protein product [Paramecium tetraurelia]|eukprot:XP_001457285.1 hypothetical protein (macronuclear) [Paramecium tetraurelia strain d4-2]
MAIRKTNLSSITKNLFNNDYDQESLFSSPLKSPDKSKSKVSSNQSPIKLDSIDNLIESQNTLRTHIPSEFNLRKMLSKMDNVDIIHQTQQQYKACRFRKKENFQSQPNLKIEVKNDVEDFFNNNTPINTQLKQNKESKQHQLITFTDYVENIYGKDWFTIPQRRFRRQTTIQEFFNIIE